MIDDPWFYVVALPAVVIAGISKGGFGGGVGLVAVPLMALTVAPPQAAAIMLPILCLMDVFGVWAYRGRWDWRILRIIVPAALVGIATGTATFRYLNADGIRLMLGMIAVGFTARYWLRQVLRVDRVARKPGWASGGFWGGVAGFTSFVAHAGGPPLSVYLLPQRLDRTIFVGTNTLFYFVINYVKLLPYGWLGQLNTGNLTTSLVLAPLVPVGMGVGLFLHRRVSERTFYGVCYWILAATGGKLVYDGLRGLS